MAGFAVDCNVVAGVLDRTPLPRLSSAFEAVHSITAPPIDRLDVVLPTKKQLVDLLTHAVNRAKHAIPLIAGRSPQAGLSLQDPCVSRRGGMDGRRRGRLSFF